MHIIIVGASSGLGYETARQYIAQGHHVGVAARRIDRLESLVALAPDRVVAAQIDVTTPEAPEALLSLIDRLGGMDLYLHSSGVGSHNRTLELQPELDTVRTNALGFTALVVTAYRYFAQRGRGHIAVISSVAGTKGIGLAPAYSATKRMNSVYLEALEQLARLQGYDICFTNIQPGFVSTPLIEGRRYPIQMEVDEGARHIISAIARRKRVAIFDWRFRILVAIWRLIPQWLWVRLPINDKP
ncbi:MAG: SDR family NAD(P)-dependent oxidoreductase [Bacteroidaceae bacterium]|nr:SDR family NAD(P)-dependent oxidoreductase [Bacteroidaceae bacterium]